LIATQKRQNAHRSIAERIRKIYQHGIFVNAGYILGFDTEKDDIADRIIECVKDTSVPINMAGLLFALPTTQLTRRLQAEGRLHEGYEIAPDGTGDQCTGGLNFDTMRPRLDILQDYLRVIETIHEPEKYFARVREVGRLLDSSKRRHRVPVKASLWGLRALARLALVLGVPSRTRGPFWRTLGSSMLRNPRSLRYVVGLMAMYLHFGPFSRYVAQQTQRAIQQEAWPSASAVVRRRIPVSVGMATETVQTG
jgi:hypothetical protein